MPPRDASIIIPCFDKVELTIQCLVSLAACTPPDRYEVVLVDNGSSDATPDMCAELEGDVVIIRNAENLGFSRACNQGAAAASGRHLLFLNNDTEALPGWFEPLVHVLDTEPDVAAVGCKLLYPDRTIQHAGVAFAETVDGPGLVAFHLFAKCPAETPGANQRRDLRAVTAACVLMRRTAFEAANGFDEGYWNGYEDVDLCLQLIDAGWRIVYEPRSELIHHESQSGPERFSRIDENTERLIERWGDRVVPDVYLGRNGDVRPHRAATGAVR